MPKLFAEMPFSSRSIGNITVAGGTGVRASYAHSSCGVANI